MARMVTAEANGSDHCGAQAFRWCHLHLRSKGEPAWVDEERLLRSEATDRAWSLHRRRSKVEAGSVEEEGYSRWAVADPASYLTLVMPLRLLD